MARRTTVAVGMLVLWSVVGTVLAGTPPRAQQVRPVEEASPGTIFAELIQGGSRSVPVGLLKRGRSGGWLYNPSTERMVLTPGDVLVDRRGQRYVVGTPQRIDGGSGAVGPGARIFAGEGGLRFVGFESQSLTGAPGQGSAGDVLDLVRSVPADQGLGVYQDPAESGLSVTVQQAKVGRLDVLNRNGGTVQPDATVQPSGFVVVRADVNFLDAERARIAMVDRTTGQTVTTGILSREEAMARYPDSASVIARLVPPGKGQPEGPDGTVRSLANPAHQPSTTIYLVQDLSAVRRTGTYQFVVGGDTRNSFGALSRAGVSRAVNVTLDTDRPSGSPSIDAPGREYVSGQTVSVGGRADPATTAVAVYVRTNGDWELLSAAFGNVSVGTDGTWGVESVDLAAQNDRFATAGARELGVISVADADVDGDGAADATLATARFEAGASSKRPLRVVVPRSQPTTRVEPTATAVEVTTTESPATRTAMTTEPTVTTIEEPTPGQPVPGFGAQETLVGIGVFLAILALGSRR